MQKHHAALQGGPQAAGNGGALLWLDLWHLGQGMALQTVAVCITGAVSIMGVGVKARQGWLLVSEHPELPLSKPTPLSP